MTLPNPIAVVLAAGKGTRLRSATPKVLHQAGGRPLLAGALAAARAAGCARTLVVVGHGAEAIRAAFPEPDLGWVVQAEQRGTGHALAQVEREVDGAATLLVLSGDVPLVQPASLARLLAAIDAGAWGALAVATVEEPGRLGRVVASPTGGLARIVEAIEATAAELAVRRVNAGLYALPAPAIFGYLAGLAPANAQGELYLTDALGAAARDGREVALVELADEREAWGVNDRAELERADRELLAEMARKS